MWIGRIIGAFPCGELRIRLSQKLRIALQSQILGIICISQIENKAALVHMGKSILGHPACTVFVMLDVLRLGDAQMTVNIKRFARIDQFFKILAAAIGLKQICCRNGIGLISAKRARIERELRNIMPAYIGIDTINIVVTVATWLNTESTPRCVELRVESGTIMLWLML